MIKNRKGNPGGWHWVCGPGNDLQPKSSWRWLPGRALQRTADQWSSFLIQSACGLGMEEGWVGWRRPTGCPSTSLKPCRSPLPPKIKGAGSSGQGLTFNPDPTLSLVYTGPEFPPPTSAQGSQHMQHLSKEALCQMGVVGRILGGLNCWDLLCS